MIVPSPAGGARDGQLRERRDAVGRAPDPHALTLRFRDPQLESAYADDVSSQAIPQIRMSAPIGGASFIAGSFVLASLVGDPRIAVLGVAGGLTSFLVLLLTWTGSFTRMMGPIQSIPYVALAACMTAVMILRPDRPVVLTVLMAELSVLIYAFVFSPMGFVQASVLGLLTLGCVLPTALLVPADLGGETPLYVLNVLNVALSVAATGYFIERYRRRDFWQRRALDAERAKSDRLLLNVLPAPIAARLKDGETVIADGYPAASSLFADLVGFAPLTRRLAPGEMVLLLNRIFSAFDQLVEQLGAVKIKTIGDGYHVVAGVPTPRADHLEVLAEMALEMRAAVARIAAEEGRDLAVRIGIDTGPVVAGVIGTKKFSFDLWGDSVNTASRMESHGIPGEIQVTETVNRRLSNAYTLEPRGVIEVKGSGAMAVYLLTGRKAAVTEVLRAG